MNDATHTAAAAASNLTAVPPGAPSTPALDVRAAPPAAAMESPDPLVQAAAAPPTAVPSSGRAALLAVEGHENAPSGAGPGVAAACVCNASSGRNLRRHVHGY